jgi:hypothetical protein
MDYAISRTSQDDAFTGRGTPLRQKRHEKVLAALARRETDKRSHLCRETGENYVPCDQVTHANPGVDLSHPRPFVRDEAETPTREKKTGGEGLNLP